MEIGFSAEGVAWTYTGGGLAIEQAVWVDLPVEPPTIEGSATKLQARVSGAAVPYDAWSTEADGWRITLRVTATDLAGNASSADTEVPVTRQLWFGVEVQTSGPVSLGVQGQILVNHGATLDSLFPDGELQSTTKLTARYGGLLQAMSRPATLVSKETPSGETYVASSSQGLFGAYSQLSSLGLFDSNFETVSPGDGQPMAFALSASRELDLRRARGL